MGPRPAASRPTCVPPPPLWENNPHLTPLHESEPGVQMLEMHYPLIHQSNQRPYHFLHGFVQHLEERLGCAFRLPASAATST
jgi:hypothetical protein